MKKKEKGAEDDEAIQGSSKKAGKEREKEDKSKKKNEKEGTRDFTC